jgi:hypothetical protein
MRRARDFARTLKASLIKEQEDHLFVRGRIEQSFAALWTYMNDLVSSLPEQLDGVEFIENEDEPRIYHTEYARRTFTLRQNGNTLGNIDLEFSDKGNRLTVRADRHEIASAQVDEDDLDLTPVFDAIELQIEIWLNPAAKARFERSSR